MYKIHLSHSFTNHLLIRVSYISNKGCAFRTRTEMNPSSGSTREETVLRFFIHYFFASTRLATPSQLFIAFSSFRRYNALAQTRPRPTFPVRNTISHSNVSKPQKAYAGSRQICLTLTRAVMPSTAEMKLVVLRAKNNGAVRLKPKTIAFCK